MKKTFFYLLIFVSFIVSTFTACTTSVRLNQKSTSVPMQTQEDGYISIPVYYGTNRNKINTDKTNMYGGEWTNEIKYGYYKASIPKNHKKGEIEQANIYRKILGQDYDPTRYINILENKNLTKDEFLNLLSQSLNNDKEDHAFIFIHGYNNSFKDAALRTAQLYYDLSYKGVPILYSWPSIAETEGYFTDAKQIEKSINLFQQFITDISKNNPNKKINIIAHSMGNRLLINAIDKLEKENPEIKFENIILAAPDVAKNDFISKHYNNIVKSAKNITLYCSKKDIALKASKIINKQNRLGYAGKDILKKEPINTVDITKVDKCGDFLNHTCFANTKLIIDDISNLLQENPLNREFNNGIHYIKQ